MPQPKQPKSARTRKQRVYKRRDKTARATAALNDAAQKRLGLLSIEVHVAQLGAIPDIDRGPDWEKSHADAERQLAGARRDVEALEAWAAELHGKPITGKERKQRDQQLRQQRIAALKNQLGAWEDTMAAHEGNLKRLDAVPEAQRDIWHEAEGIAWQGALQVPRDSSVLWETAAAAEEQALDTLERGIAVCEKLLAAEAPTDAELADKSPAGGGVRP